MKPIRIFISSAQKELELERTAVAGLISTDPFLLQHGVPVLFEQEPPPHRPLVPCLALPDLEHQEPQLPQRCGRELVPRSVGHELL